MSYASDKQKESGMSGLYSKYIVHRADGRDRMVEDKHYCCEYFVLDIKHDPHARAALIAYAGDCEQRVANLQLARDIREWVQETDMKNQKISQEARKGLGPFCTVCGRHELTNALCRIVPFLVDSECPDCRH